MPVEKQIDLKIPSSMYGVTDCIIDIERFRKGKRIFPCSDGNDHYLQPYEVENVWTMIRLMGK